MRACVCSCVTDTKRQRQRETETALDQKEKKSKNVVVRKRKRINNLPLHQAGKAVSVFSGGDETWSGLFVSPFGLSCFATRALQARPVSISARD